jgi:hypothetical protein
VQDIQVVSIRMVAVLLRRFRYRLPHYAFTNPAQFVTALRRAPALAGLVAFDGMLQATMVMRDLTGSRLAPVAAPRRQTDNVALQPLRNRQRVEGVCQSGKRLTFRGSLETARPVFGGGTVPGRGCHRFRRGEPFVISRSSRPTLPFPFGGSVT